MYKIQSLTTIVVVIFAVVASADFCTHTPDDFDYCFDDTCGVPVANPNKFHPCVCTEENVGYKFTECDPDTNSRTLIYYWKPPATCQGGGIVLPPHVDGIPCDLFCTNGTFINIETMRCEACAAGTFSAGGARTWSSWTEWPAQFTTTCAIGDPSAHCNSWELLGKTIDSGNNINVDYLESQLTLRFHNVIPGNITFTYRVSSEPNYDGLYFIVDDLGVMFASGERHWTNVTFPLSEGFHTVQWTYFKDQQGTYGEDHAVISSITLVGTSVSDANCEECPAGMYSDLPQQSTCKTCPENTFSGMGATACSPCPTGQYSFAGSDHCVSRKNCTELDYTYSYSACDLRHNTRTKTYTWIQPLACDQYDFSLPPSETVPCEAIVCQPGQYKTGTTTFDGSCLYCPDNSYTSSPSSQSNSCMMCTVGGLVNERVEYMTDWTNLPSGWTTGCNGDCFTSGWRTAVQYIDSGLGNGANSESWVSGQFTLESLGSIDVDYTLSCTPGSIFSLLIDGVVAHAISCSGCSSIVYRLSHDMIYPGTHTLKMSYRKAAVGMLTNSTASGCDRVIITAIKLTGVAAGVGGSTGCQSCPKGTYGSGKAGGACIPCKAGQFGNETNAKNCYDCAADTFSYDGQTACYFCLSNTYAPPAATKCTYDCHNLTLTFYPLAVTPAMASEPEIETWDLTPLIKDTPYTITSKQFYDNTTFYFSPCKSVPNPCWEDGHNRTMLCRAAGYYGGSNKDLGFIFGFDNIYQTAEAGIQIMLENPENACYSIIYVNCNPDEKNIASSKIVLTDMNDDGENTCFYSFKWDTIYGCPLCSADDYSTTVSDCVNGYITTTYQWTSRTCHDGVRLPNTTTVACTPVVQVQRHTALAIAVGVLVSAGVACGGLIYLYNRKRTLEAAYSRLEFQSKNVPMVEQEPPSSNVEQPRI